MLNHIIKSIKLFKFSSVAFLASWMVMPTSAVTIYGEQEMRGSDLPQAKYMQYAKDGYYLGIIPGFSFGVSANNRAGSSGNTDTSFNLPLRFNLSGAIRFGRKLGELRSELEFSYIHAVMTKISDVQREFQQQPLQIVIPADPGAGFGGAVFNVPLPPIRLPAGVKLVETTRSHIFFYAANFYYDFLRTFGNNTPYVGGGIGLINRHGVTKYLGGVKEKSSGINATLHFMIGSECNIKKNFALMSEFRLVILPGGDKKFREALGDFWLKKMPMHIRFNFGAIYRFG